MPRGTLWTFTTRAETAEAQAALVRDVVHSRNAAHLTPEDPALAVTEEPGDRTGPADVVDSPSAPQTG